MANTITLKRRIASIKNTRQITKAMELVSSSKLRRAQRQAQASRDYREAAYALLARLSGVQEVERQPLFRKRTVKTRLYVVVTSSNGLAGAYNANVLKLLTQAIRQDQADKVKSSVITIGSKGVQFVRRLQNVELVAHYPAFGDEPTENDILPLLNSVVSNYVDETVDEVRLLYTVFKSSIVQEATNLQLLPAHLDGAEAKQPDGMLNFEPDVETVIQQTGARLVQAQIWQAILESLASEHAMRAVAMKNATDNATELIGDYTLEYNTARQAAITQELAEISGGAEALNG
ncbi:MAG TPA: ATP synthase F1 subunit gamma [Candidatus Saccharimonadales bacterium]|nr:ATP synthase F1 subunit gamma [Candidatus Saccharimonadales bacterium]